MFLIYSTLLLSWKAWCNKGNPLWYKSVGRKSAKVPPVRRGHWCPTGEATGAPSGLIPHYFCHCGKRKAWGSLRTQPCICTYCTCLYQLGIYIYPFKLVEHYSRLLWRQANKEFLRLLVVDASSASQNRRTWLWFTERPPRSHSSLFHACYRSVNFPNKCICANLCEELICVKYVRNKWALFLL